VPKVMPKSFISLYRGRFSFTFFTIQEISEKGIFSKETFFLQNENVKRKKVNFCAQSFSSSNPGHLPIVSFSPLFLIMQR